MPRRFDNTCRHDDPHGVAGIAEFERDLISERTGASRVIAKTNGVPFGRPRKVNTEQRAWPYACCEKANPPVKSSKGPMRTLRRPLPSA
jgi:hypothetical protein